MKILQIVPNPPETVCGVGDHAQLLAAKWIESGEATAVTLHAASITGRSHHRPGIDPQATELLKVSIKQQLPAEAIVLHMSCHGFASKGVPQWIKKTLDWLATLERRPVIVIMFHELYAPNPRITQRSWWLQPFQKWVLARLARLADVILTNRESNRRWLISQLPPFRPVTCLPVFSNLGEDFLAVKPSSKAPKMVLFTRSNHDWNHTAKCVQMLNIEEVLVLSAASPVPTDLPIRAKFTQMGYTPSDKTHALLSTARAGLIQYDPQYLARSGLFAAITAHRLLPILSAATGPLEDGLVTDKHVLSAEHIREFQGDESKLDEIADHAHAWYRTHDLRTTASIYLRLIEHYLQNEEVPRAK